MLWTSLFFAASVAGKHFTSPPENAKVVSPLDGDYVSLQEAVDSIDKESEETTHIFIQPGNYTGQTRIRPGFKGAIVVRGSTINDQTYSQNQVVLSNGLSSATAGGNVQSATLWVETPHVSFYNVVIENTAGNAGPSHALSAGASQIAFYGCSLTGWQDTVWVSEPNTVFKNSYIEGAVDFIYGGRANIWIEQSDIGFARETGGYITASGRTEDDENWYVINSSRIIPKAGVTVRPESVTLGRAWRDHARVVFQNTEMTNIVNKLAWSAWAGVPDNLFYAEVDNYGPGADTSGRVEWAIQLDEPVNVDDIMPGWQLWVDLDYWNAQQ